MKICVILSKDMSDFKEVNRLVGYTKRERSGMLGGSASTMDMDDEGHLNINRQEIFTQVDCLLTSLVKKPSLLRSTQIPLARLIARSFRLSHHSHPSLHSMFFASFILPQIQLHRSDILPESPLLVHWTTHFTSIHYMASESVFLLEFGGWRHKAWLTSQCSWNARKRVKDARRG